MYLHLEGFNAFCETIPHGGIVEGKKDALWHDVLVEIVMKWFV